MKLRQEGEHEDRGTEKGSKGGGDQARLLDDDTARLSGLKYKL